MRRVLAATTHHCVGIAGHQGRFWLGVGVGVDWRGGLGQGGEGEDDGVEGAGIGAADLGDVAVDEVDAGAGRGGAVGGESGDGLGAAVGEEEEGGHGGDAVGLGDGRDVVDVDLGKGEAAGDAAGSGHLGVERRNGLAGRTPVGEEVGDDVRVGRDECRKLICRRDVGDNVNGGGAGGRHVEGQR